MNSRAIPAQSKTLSALMVADRGIGWSRTRAGGDLAQPSAQVMEVPSPDDV